MSFVKNIVKKLFFGKQLTLFCKQMHPLHLKKIKNKKILQFLIKTHKTGLFFKHCTLVYSLNIAY